MSLQGKQLKICVANDQMLAFKQIREFWKTSLCHRELDSLSCDETAGDINNCGVFFFYMV